MLGFSALVPRMPNAECKVARGYAMKFSFLVADTLQVLQSLVVMAMKSFAPGEFLEDNEENMKKKRRRRQKLREEEAQRRGVVGAQLAVWEGRKGPAVSVAGQAPEKKSKKEQSR